jgi:hypothetical protein
MAWIGESLNTQILDTGSTSWLVGYDLDRVRRIAERKRFDQRAIPEACLVLFTHDHATPMGYVTIGEKGRAGAGQPFSGSAY